MKQNQRLFGGLLACAMMFALATVASAESAPPGSAKVIRMMGSARWSMGNSGVWQPLKVGDMLTSGTLIQTAGNGSYVDLVLYNEHATFGEPAPANEAYKPPGAGSGGGPGAGAKEDAIRVYADTVLSLDKLTYYKTGADTVSETQLDLKAGKIFGTVKKLSAASRYEIKIPTGVAGIRGTEYMVSAEGVVTVISGQVVLSYIGPDGSVVTQVIAAGEQFDIRTQTLGPAQPVSDPFPPIFSQPLVFTSFDHTIFIVSPSQPVPQG
jgi:FecR protein